MKLWFAPIVCLAFLSCSSCEEVGNPSPPVTTPAKAPGAAQPPAGGYYRTAPVPSVYGDLPPSPVVAPGSSPATPSVD